MKNSHSRYEIWRETLKNVENEKKKTVGPEIWRETLKNVKMRQAHCRTRNMARNLKIIKNEKHTLQEVEYDEKE
jgi:hypothetical protein